MARWNSYGSVFGHKILSQSRSVDEGHRGYSSRSRFGGTSKGKIVIPEKINKAKDKLLEKANALATKVYEEAAKNNQGAEANTEEKEEKTKKADDGVVDAEYEEK